MQKKTSLLNKENAEVLAAQKLVATLTSSEHGFDDFDIANHPICHRMTVGHSIKKGDICNVYCKGGVKHGVKWLGGVEKSLLSFDFASKTEKTNA